MANHLVIVDESVRKRYVEKLKDKKVEVLYIGNDEGLEKGMPDVDIMELGHTLGCVPIATCNPRHFKNYKGKIISLRQMDSDYSYLRKTQKAGIEIKGRLF